MFQVLSVCLILFVMRFSVLFISLTCAGFFIGSKQELLLPFAYDFKAYHGKPFVQGLSIDKYSVYNLIELTE